MKMLSLFSGIGAFEKALQRLGVEVDLAGYCEIDKHASRAYCAVHGVSEDMNLVDVAAVDTSTLPKDIDLITYGFPCQDISIAGKQAGFEKDGERTRSGLFFEALRIIEDTQPKVAIAENVKQLLAERFAGDFGTVLSSLEQAGYSNYYAVLNARDYGVPQNRERVFIVSIRKDIDRGFRWPSKIALQIRLRDVLEPDVDERFFLSDKMLAGYLAHKDRHSESGNGFGFAPIDADKWAHAITTKEGQRPGDNYLAFRVGNEKGHADAVAGDGIRLGYPKSTTNRGRVHPGVSATLTASANEAAVVSNDPPLDSRQRVRRLTPLECWRLMGFDDADCEKASKVVSNSQLYKQAGNSIVVPVLEAIFDQLLADYPQFRPEGWQRTWATDDELYTEPTLF